MRWPFLPLKLKKAASKALSDKVFLATVTAGPVFRMPISCCMIGGLICKGEFKGGPGGARPLLSGNFFFCCKFVTDGNSSFVS